jgi:D-3-phosphoglycerate dehydrogenase
MMDGELWRTPEKLRAAVAGCRALLVRNQTRVTAELIAAAPQLEIIGRAGAGLDNIDVAAATAAGIVVASTPDQNSVSVAELAIGFMFALARKITTADHDTHAGGWNRQRFAGVELNGKTFGVVGLGRIGFLTALRARALGMRIVAHDQFVGPDAVAVTETHARLVSLDELLQHSDFVSCHVPLTTETRGLFGYERFAAMKRSAFFLNLSRGEVVNETGLVRALREERLAGAALDVREVEPPGTSPLNDFENVILTPHIAAFTREAQDRVVNAVCADLAAVLRGERARNFANLSRPQRLAARG